MEGLKKRQFFHFLVLSLISPIIGLYYALKSKGNTQKWSLILLVVLFGSVILLGSSDGAVHLSRVYENYLNLSFSGFVEEFWNIIYFRPAFSKGDMYLHFLSFGVGSILGSPGLLFPLVSLVYGYFYISSLTLVFQKYGGGTLYSLLSIGIAVMMIMWLNVTNLQTIRTWTGAWILFYGALHYFETREWKYLLLIACAPLFHVAYFLMSLPVWVVVVLGNRRFLYTILYTTSFFVSVGGSFITENLATTELGEGKVKGYYQEDAGNLYSIENRSGNIYVQWGKRGTNLWALNLFAFAIIGLGLYGRPFPEALRKLFACGLVLITLANVMSSIPAVFNRTMANAGLYILVYTFAVQHQLSSLGGIQKGRLLLWKLVLVIGLLLYVPSLLFQLSYIIQFASVFLLGLPFIPWFFTEVNMSIREFIGLFLF